MGLLKNTVAEADAAILLSVKEGDIVIQVTEGMEEDFVIEVLQATILMLQSAQGKEQEVYRRNYRH